MKKKFITRMPYMFELFFYLVCEAIGTAATPDLLCQPQVIVKMIVGKQMECRLAGETEVLRETLPQRHFCPSQNPTWPDPGLNPGSRWLTAWAMVWPCLDLLLLTSFMKYVNGLHNVILIFTGHTILTLHEAQMSNRFPQKWLIVQIIHTWPKI
jgi:hypothetical protein